MIKWMAPRLQSPAVDIEPKFPQRESSARVRDGDIRMFYPLFAAPPISPSMLFHVSTAEGAAVLFFFCGEGIKVFAETCPQYLFLTAQRPKPAGS